MLADPRNRVGSIGHVFLPCLPPCGAQPIGIRRPLEVALPAG
jgi:hypothetical protein